MSMLAKNKSGWCLLEYLPIKEEEIENYDNVTGAFAIICVQGKYLIGYNQFRKQWEFPAGGIESGETARQAAERELWEETHQRCSELEFRGLFKIQKPDGGMRYQAIFRGTLEEVQPFIGTDADEMERIMLWDLQEDIGDVDRCDLKMVELACV